MSADAAAHTDDADSDCNIGTGTSAAARDVLRASWQYQVVYHGMGLVIRETIRLVLSVLFEVAGPGDDGGGLPYDGR